MADSYGSLFVNTPTAPSPEKWTMPRFSTTAARRSGPSSSSSGPPPPLRASRPPDAGGEGRGGGEGCGGLRPGPRDQRVRERSLPRSCSPPVPRPASPRTATAAAAAAAGPGPAVCASRRSPRRVECGEGARGPQPAAGARVAANNATQRDARVRKRAVWGSVPTGHVSTSANTGWRRAAGGTARQAGAEVRERLGVFEVFGKKILG